MNAHSTRTVAYSRNVMRSVDDDDDFVKKMKKKMNRLTTTGS